MLTPATAIRDWRDLQDKVADLFREMGYDVVSPHVVKLVRGSKEVDVYVTDPRTSVPQTILIECKHWASAVKQETVHGFQTVMRDCDANTGIIVSSGGFQSGAAEAAANSNIQLKTWESLQTAYGNEWYLRQKERLKPLEEKLRSTNELYLDQWQAPRSLMNQMRFEHLGRFEDLFDLLAEGRMFIFAMIGAPKSYDQPGPIEAAVHEGWPGSVKDKHGMPIVVVEDVRAWFRWITEGATSVLARIKALEDEVFASFEALSDDETERAFANTERAIREETPIRVLRAKVGDEEFSRLLSLLGPTRPGA